MSKANGIAVYNNIEKVGANDRTAKPTLVGMKTLNEVQHKLSLMKKNKDSIEARLHFYESKLDTELP